MLNVDRSFVFRFDVHFSILLTIEKIASRHRSARPGPLHIAQGSLETLGMPICDRNKIAIQGRHVLLHWADNVCAEEFFSLW